MARNGRRRRVWALFLTINCVAGTGVHTACAFAHAFFPRSCEIQLLKIELLRAWRCCYQVHRGRRPCTPDFWGSLVVSMVLNHFLLIVSPFAASLISILSLQSIILSRQRSPTMSPSASCGAIASRLLQQLSWGWREGGCSTEKLGQCCKAERPALCPRRAQ